MSDETISKLTPDNTNNLFSDKFRFSIRKLPTVSFFCTEATVPGVAVQNIQVPNSINRLNVAGNKVQFNELVITFKVDEDLKNFKELYNWIIGIGAPQSFDQFKKLVEDNELGLPGYQIYSDATLITLTNSMNVNVDISFTDLYPTTLSDIQLNEATSGQPVTATANFVYLNYKFNN
jgi:hypothetical protein